MSDASSNTQQERYRSLLSMIGETQPFRHPTRLIQELVPLFFTHNKKVTDVYRLFDSQLMKNKEITAAFSVPDISSYSAYFNRVPEVQLTGHDAYLEKIGLSPGDRYIFPTINEVPISNRLEDILDKQREIDTALTLKGNVIRATLNTITPIQATFDEDDIFI